LIQRAKESPDESISFADHGDTLSAQNHTVKKKAPGQNEKPRRLLKMLLFFNNLREKVKYIPKVEDQGSGVVQ
jgi:hypothetical protein